MKLNPYATSEDRLIAEEAGISVKTLRAHRKAEDQPIRKPHHTLTWGWQDRPQIVSAALSGKKSAWIQVEHKGVVFSGMVSRALVRQLAK